MRCSPYHKMSHLALDFICISVGVFCTTTATTFPEAASLSGACFASLIVLFHARETEKRTTALAVMIMSSLFFGLIGPSIVVANWAHAWAERQPYSTWVFMGFFCALFGWTVVLFLLALREHANKASTPFATWIIRVTIGAASSWITRFFAHLFPKKGDEPKIPPTDPTI